MMTEKLFRQWLIGALIPAGETMDFANCDHYGRIVDNILDTGKSMGIIFFSGEGLHDIASFLNEARGARETFSRQAGTGQWWLDLGTNRVFFEDVLILYDQMVSRLERLQLSQGAWGVEFKPAELKVSKANHPDELATKILGALNDYLCVPIDTGAVKVVNRVLEDFFQPEGMAPMVEKKAMCAYCIVNLAQDDTDLNGRPVCQDCEAEFWGNDDDSAEIFYKKKQAIQQARDLQDEADIADINAKQTFNPDLEFSEALLIDADKLMAGYQAKGCFKFDDGEPVQVYDQDTVREMLCRFTEDVNRNFEDFINITRVNDAYFQATIKKQWKTINRLGHDRARLKRQVTDNAANLYTVRSELVKKLEEAWKEGREQRREFAQKVNELEAAWRDLNSNKLQLERQLKAEQERSRLLDKHLAEVRELNVKYGNERNYVQSLNKGLGEERDRLKGQAESFAKLNKDLLNQLRSEQAEVTRIRTALANVSGQLKDLIQGDTPSSGGLGSPSCNAPMPPFPNLPNSCR